MGKINSKTIIRNVLGFVNFGNMIKITMWWLWFRRNRVFFIFEGHEYTYREVYLQSRRYESFFLNVRKKLVDSGKLDKDKRLAFGVYMDNTPEFLYASFGAGLSNSIMFAINSGFRGDTLAKVMEQAGIKFLIINANTLKEVECVIKNVPMIGPENVYFVGDKDAFQSTGFKSLDEGG